ncbi:PSB3 protein, partial [Leucopsar rothschildi]|nr:PSB3 protein [Leucopsar rothschildi]
QSIMSYNGGAVMAMRGKDCVAIAADRRFGIQAQTVTTDFQKIFPMGQRLYIGLAGLATDVQTVAQRLKFRLNLYELKEGRQIKPQTFMSMVSNLLYERSSGGAEEFFCKICSWVVPQCLHHLPWTDCCCLGVMFAPQIVSNSCCSRVVCCAKSVAGCSWWSPGKAQVEPPCSRAQEPEHLFETISQAMLNAVDRDAISGMGVVVHVIEKDKITTRTLKARMD